MNKLGQCCNPGLHAVSVWDFSCPTPVTAFVLLHLFFTNLVFIPVTATDAAARQLNRFLLFPLARTLLSFVIICVFWAFIICIGTWTGEGWEEQQCRNTGTGGTDSAKWENKPGQSSQEVGSRDGAVESTHHNNYPNGDAEERQSNVFINIS